MSFDPTLNTYALAVVGASGVVAAGMHATALAGSGTAWPARRVLIANLISTALVGMAVAEIIRHAPLKVDLIPVLLIAAITGHTLGPRGVPWLFSALLGGLRRLPWMPPLPEPPPPLTEGTKETKDA